MVSKKRHFLGQDGSPVNTKSASTEMRHFVIAIGVVCWVNLGLVDVTYTWGWFRIYLGWVLGLFRISFSFIEGLSRVYLELL